MLRGLLQDGAVLALVLDLLGQAGHGGLAICSQGDLSKAATVDEARSELRGEGRSLLGGQAHRCDCACVLVDNYERGGELLVRVGDARVGLDEAIVGEEHMLVKRCDRIG